MEIRSATPQDVPRVVPMVRKIAEMHRQLEPAKYTFRSDPGEMYRDWLVSQSKSPRGVFLVADAGENLVGFLVATVVDELPIYAVEEVGFIHDVWVEEAYRHEGIARQLVTLCVERFGKLGVPQVRCDTAWANPAARELFTRCGFRPGTVEMLIEVNNG